MKIANAQPTKEFFVHMITKDISLKDCILDLIDNCLDGARRTSQATNDELKYKGFRASLNITSEEFSIEDNCGGISISNAIDYAFRFGRNPNSPAEGDYSIGLYGIGMKRAIFKIGKNIRINSSTASESFTCNIFVDEWLIHDKWEFELEDDEINGTRTKIFIVDLHDGISKEFDDSAFINGLISVIARDYALFIESGFEIFVNDREVQGNNYKVRTSEEFQPYRNKYHDSGVQVEILAGMASLPPNSSDPSDRVDPDSSGWFVVCNDRVVLAADKTDRTVWGNDGFTRWHPQYNGFLGMVLFNSRNPNLLPWTTTKRDIDRSSPMYRRALTKMRLATSDWTEYTTRRKVDLEKAKVIERETSNTTIFTVSENKTLKFPRIAKSPTIRMANIHYQKPVGIVKTAAKALGNTNLNYRGVGEKTFEYFFNNEVQEEE